MNSTLLVLSVFVLVASTVHAWRTQQKMSEHTIYALIASTVGFMLFLWAGDVFSAALVLGWGYLIAWALEYAHRPQWEPVYAKAVAR